MTKHTWRIAAVVAVAGLAFLARSDRGRAREDATVAGGVVEARGVAPIRSLPSRRAPSEALAVEGNEGASGGGVPTAQEQSVQRAAWTDERTRSFLQNATGRIATLRDRTCAEFLAHVHPDFVASFPYGARLMREHPDSTLAELFEVPDEAEFVRAAEDPDVRVLCLECDELTQLVDAVGGFFSQELDFLRGRAEAMSIEQYLSPWEERIDTLFADRDAFWLTVSRIGEVTSAGLGGAMAEEDFGRESTELQFALDALTWRERCARENRVLDKLDRDARFWMSASRAAMLPFYDDSFWFPEDESTAWTLGLSRHFDE